MKYTQKTISLVIALTMMIWTAEAVGQETEEEGAMFDHLVYAAPNLQAASDRIEDELGIEPLFGGSHSGGGTMNSLLSLGDRQYLEVARVRPTSKPTFSRVSAS